MKCFSIPSDSDDDDQIFEEQVCPICGPAGGIEASDDGNRDQSCGTCGKVLLIDGKLPSLPDLKQFEKLFPTANPKNVKQVGMFKGSGMHFVDKSTCINYAYGGGKGWRQMEFICAGDSKMNNAPQELKDLFPGVMFTKVIPGVQYKDSDGNVYGKFEQEGWKNLSKITTG